MIWNPFSDQPLGVRLSHCGKGLETSFFNALARSLSKESTF